MNGEVWFYEPDHENGYLSNFSSHPIVLGDNTWPTSEHYYQAQKFMDPEIQEEIMRAETPEKAFELSRNYANQVRSDWLFIRCDVMKYIVYEKFRQYPSLIHLLVSTGDKPIKEHSKSDGFWGDGGDGTGRNELGKILMEVREHFSQQEPFDLIHYVDHAKLPTQYGTFIMYGFLDPKTGKDHVALCYGKPKIGEPVLIRLHSECLTGDALFSARCDCGFQLSKALENIVENGSGILLYLRQEGRGIGLLNKIRAYRLQDGGADTVEANEQLGFEADMRDYTFCRGMLSFLGVSEVKLMTNNPRKVKALTDVGINVVERVKLQEGYNEHNAHYINTKAAKLGHMFDKSHMNLKKAE